MDECDQSQTDIRLHQLRHTQDFLTMIRPYTTTDKQAVLSIWREASELAHPFLTAQQLDQAEAMIRDQFMDMAEIYIADHEGQPVGFIALIGNEVGGLFLRPSLHGRGIGKALMDRAVKVKNALSLEVFTNNAIGRKFYRSYGFVEGSEKMDPFFGHPVLELTFTP